ncbi:hypothetical protein NE237_027525 [Protea cynaroides]|uniref:Auxin-responsive protein n=1 Tax=Protea cynaroides TaxID=273540 RepID=A0A9Q0GQB2_9MAGN|nr:hypothetical protein NE237_027525 [Protea cynaroides]
MELQLGLALPSNPIKDLDLNKHDPKDEFWTHSCCSTKNKAHKQSFDEDFEIVSPTLPLLSWNDKPNDDDGNGKSLENNYCIIHESNGEGDGIMGWPPITRCRRNLLHLLHQQQQQQQNQNGRAQHDRRDGRPNSMYVKVKMEGVAIGRKVNLSLHRSYQTLTNTLIAMFGEFSSDQGDDKRSNNGGRYTLTYQDRDGNWLLLGDIPWQTFLGSVQRLKILRSGGSLARVFRRNF